MKVLVANPNSDPNLPWGGGNVINSRLMKRMKAKGWELTNKLDGYMPDVCYCCDVRNEPMLQHAIVNDIPIVLRVGDVGTHSKPEILKLLVKWVPLCTKVIWTSDWAATYYNESSHEDWDINGVIIENTADDEYFPYQKPRVVTHHWSNNPNKGAFIYEFIQNHIEELNIEFTFIGRPCFNADSNKINVMAPMTKSALQEELLKHNWYLTASIEEAGANHVLEAYNSGLPIIYHKRGGSIPEYIGHRGIWFNSTGDLLDIFTTPLTINALCKEYMEEIQEASFDGRIGREIDSVVP